MYRLFQDPEKKPSGIPKKGRLNQVYLDKNNLKMRKLICIWCDDIFLEPQRLYCGHTVCKRCIDSQIEKSKRHQISLKCLICGSLLDENEIGEDRIAKSIVQNIKVRCSSKNCKWQGLNKNFLQHYQHECEFNQRVCDSRYEFTYFSNKAEFSKKLNDDEQKRQHRPNMLLPQAVLTLRQKMQKESEIQWQFDNEIWRRKTKIFRRTFGQ